MPQAHHEKLSYTSSPFSSTFHYHDQTIFPYDICPTKVKDGILVEEIDHYAGAPNDNMLAGVLGRLAIEHR
ncbi:hypothetical protein KIN20_012600 [Parelaphostrongylus tenuis]|uniref:Uncharacterized protein n=1 Tax=Parelaphostrongylus tenuis TaxID=148309 RepID=A0AAD5MEE7_PARTN|nr:hypothetical protein KIN20_012600 [Parelaphostrongylus tenuis]